MAEHHIICDECGTYPFTGIRYKSRRIYDYDCCQVCMKDNHTHDLEDFAEMPNPVPYEEADRAGPPQENRICTSSMADAKEQLRQGRNATLAIFRFHRAPSTEECHEFVSFLNTNTFLKRLEIHMIGYWVQYEEAVAIMAQGLAKNQSIVSLCWSMPCSARGKACIADSLQRLIEENKTLEILLFSRPHYRAACGQCKDEWPSRLLQGLQKNRTIRTFRLDTCSLLTPTEKKLAYSAVSLNPSLIQLHINVEEWEAGPLDLLLKLNRNPHWMLGWTDVAASNMDRFHIIQEIMGCKSDQIVPILFNLFQNSPQHLRVEGN